MTEAPLPSAPSATAFWKKLLSLLAALAVGVGVVEVFSDELGFLPDAQSLVPPSLAEASPSSRGPRLEVSALFARPEPAFARPDPDLEAPARSRGLRSKVIGLFRRPDPDLKVNQTFRPTRPGACLRFIHVPKAGGTTIENMYNQTRKKPDPRVLGWGRFGEGLNNSKELFTVHTEFGDRKCFRWHTPPKSVEGLWETSYSMCDTFCIVRHPLDKLVSEWQYFNAKQGCNSSNFAEWVRPRLSYLTNGDVFKFTCHWLPQHYFVYHYPPEGMPERVCTHVLRFERLRDDFNELMTAYRYNLRMDNQHSNKRAECKIEIPEDIHAMNRAVYAADYGFFGYK